MLKKIGLLIIVLGLGVFTYFGYGWWMQRQSIQNMSHEELNEFLGYDGTYTEKMAFKSDRESFDFHKGDEIGELKFPNIEKKYPIFWGTDDETLKSGVGMHDSRWTVTPNRIGHVLLAGHRDTVFEEMGELKIGNVISIEFKGDTYVYQIRQVFVTHKDDRTVIVEKDRALLTISTCYPFQYIGDAPYRYIIQSELIDVK